jgi:hypothetical protein
MVLGGAIVWLGFTWSLSLPTWGAAWRLHRPTAYGCQAKAQSPLTNVVLLFLVSKLLLKVSPPMLAHTLLLSGKGAESLDRCRLVLIAPCGAVQASDYPFPKGREPRASCFSVESLSPQ